MNKVIRRGKDAGADFIKVSRTSIMKNCVVDFWTVR